MKRLHIYIFHFLLLSFLGGLTGCGELLGVRDPEPPDRPTESHWTPATTPPLVIENLKQAFLYREFETYMKCLSDTHNYNLPAFRFQPSTVSSIKYPGKFDAWSPADEQVWFQSLLAACPPDSLLNVTITEDEPFVESQDTVEYQFTYVLDVHHNREGPPTYYEGKGVFKMVRDSRNYWLIYFWEDISTGEPGWTDLKALF